MAGPRRSGPAPMGSETKERLYLEDQFLLLHYSGLTHAKIAERLDLERSTVTKMIPRIKTDVIAVTYPMNRAEELVFLEYADLTRRFWSYLPLLYSDSRKFTPKLRHVAAWCKLGDAIWKILGGYGAGLPGHKEPCASRHARARQLRTGRPRVRTPDYEEPFLWIADRISMRDQRERAAK